jgi:Skp family chaperone for outer membrane proteins
MQKRIQCVTVLTFTCLSLIAPAIAQKSATVKIGYFNQALVRASYPEAAGNEALKNQAENQLRHDVDNANKQIQQMQQDKKSADEIQKAVRESQIAINAKTQALTQLLQTQNAMAREKVQEAVNLVAKEKGLDLVIDGEGVFAGGKTVLDNGVDITNDVVKKLAPLAQTTVKATPLEKAANSGASNKAAAAAKAQ